MEPLFDVNGLVVWFDQEIRFRDRVIAEFPVRIADIMKGLNPSWTFVRCETPLLTPRRLINPNYTEQDVWVQGDPQREAHLSQFRRDMADPDRRREFVTHQMKLAQESGDLDHPQQAADPEAEIDRDLMAAAGYEGTVENPGFTREYFEDWLVWRNLANELVLRPETTPGSYVVARHLFDNHHALGSKWGHKPPLCVWQVGKSFRREPDQPYMHMRLKEFYQLEFQCIYGDDTALDYHAEVLEPLRQLIGLTVGLPTRIVPSDRLPTYSEKTTDIETWTGEKWLELCSISTRTDFPGTVRIGTKKGEKDIGVKVLEIAIGADRLIYAHSKAKALQESDAVIPEGMTPED